MRQFGRKTLSINEHIIVFYLYHNTSFYLFRIYLLFHFDFLYFHLFNFVLNNENKYQLKFSMIIDRNVVYVDFDIYKPLLLASF
jgi:hypothetical protein